MKAAQGGVNISILGKDLMVSCPESERSALIAAARYLDEKMREVQDGGKVIGTERCAVMAALNLANELLELRKQAAGIPADIDRRLQFLRGKIDAALHEEIV
ncbi:MAG: cell division protein ZapA [Gammaproteobacteria bacterium]|nr:cell division protein ZapA [Gammaproteobacteria bacterium]